MARKKVGLESLPVRTIEHNHNFRVLFRLMKQVAPEFYLIATDIVPKDHFALDLRKNTIEVSDQNGVDFIIAAGLIQIGHLRLRGIKRFSFLFCDIKNICSNLESEFQASEEEVATLMVGRLSVLSEQADKKALRWSLMVLRSLWPQFYDSSSRILKTMVWDKTAWKQYYDSKNKVASLN